MCLHLAPCCASVPLLFICSPTTLFTCSNQVMRRRPFHELEEGNDASDFHTHYDLLCATVALKHKCVQHMLQLQRKAERDSNGSPST